MKQYIAYNATILTMNIHTLRLYITLCEQLHFRKTSEQYHMTVSTLTRQIQRLEDTLNTVLFDRSNRHVSLTKPGKLLYEFAKNTLHNYDQLHHTLHPSETETLQGSIKLYSTVTAAYHILPPLIKSFRKKHPNVITYLETGELKQGIDRLRNNETDFTIGMMTPKKKASFHYKKVLSTQLVFIIPIKSTKKKPEDIPLIFPEKGDLSTLIKQYLHGQSVSIHSYVEGHEAILAMVAAGIGGAILPQIVVENSHLSNAIQSIPQKKPLPTIEVGLFMKKSTLISPEKKAFWELMNQTA